MDVFVNGIQEELKNSKGQWKSGEKFKHLFKGEIKKHFSLFLSVF